MESKYEEHEMKIFIFEAKDVFCDLTTSGDDGEVQSVPGNKPSDY